MKWARLEHVDLEIAGCGVTVLSGLSGCDRGILLGMRNWLSVLDQAQLASGMISIAIRNTLVGGIDPRQLRAPLNITFQPSNLLPTSLFEAS